MTERVTTEEAVDALRALNSAIWLHDARFAVAVRETGKATDVIARFESEQRLGNDPLQELVNAARFALLYHDEPCRPDHHGYCQTHNLEPVDLCWVPALRKALAGLRLTEDASAHKGK